MTNIITTLLNSRICNFYKCIEKKAKLLLDNYSFLYISNQSSFDKSNLINEISESKILVINQLNDSHPENRFLIICLHRQIILIQEKSLHLFFLFFQIPKIYLFVSYIMISSQYFQSIQRLNIKIYYIMKHLQMIFHHLKQFLVLTRYIKIFLTN